MRRHLLKYAAYVLLTAAAALVSGAVFLFSEASAERRAGAYSEYLRNAGALESVSVYDEIFSIESGTVRDAQGTEIRGARALPALELAYAMTASRRTPPLALPDVDPDDLAGAARDLAGAAELIAGEQANWRDATAVERTLYPTNYLAEAAQAERARRAFLELGTKASLLAYESALADMRASYRRDLAKFTRSFESIVPDDIGRYATERHLVARSDIVETLHEFKTRIDEIDALVRERQRCFHGDVSACSAAHLMLPDIRSPKPAGDNGLSHAKHMHALLASSGIPLASHRLVKLQDSACIKNEPDRGLYFSEEHIDVPGTSLAYDTPFFVGDALFMDTAPLSDLPFYSFFREKGVRYVLIRPVAFYTCPFADIDIDAVISAKSVAAFAEESPLSAHDPSLKPLERRLLEGDVLAESDALAYLSAGRDLLERGALSQAEAHRILELLLSSARGGSGVLYTALDIASGERIELRTKDRGVNTDFSALFRFFPRSGSVSLFSGVATQDVRVPLFKERQSSKDDQPIIRYSDAVSKGATDATLMSDIAAFARIHSFD